MSISSVREVFSDVVFPLRSEERDSATAGDAIRESTVWTCTTSAFGITLISKEVWQKSLDTRKSFAQL